MEAKYQQLNMNNKAWTGCAGILYLHHDPLQVSQCKTSSGGALQVLEMWALSNLGAMSVIADTAFHSNSADQRDKTVYVSASLVRSHGLR